MRADRLIAALMVLQARGQITAAELATELEVSERTARRDLDALAISGVPIYSTPGRGGGWRLVGGATTDLSGLSTPEANALFLAAGPALDGNPHLRSALLKLTSALPETMRDSAQQASVSLKVDPTGWGRIGRTSETPELLDVLTGAVVNGVRLRMDYEGPNAPRSTREVDPLGLVTKQDKWYLVANTARGIRTYRVDRMSSAEPLDEPVDRPDDFDLDAVWDDIVTAVESKRIGISVEVLVHGWAVGPMKWQFGTRCDIGQPIDDGRVRLQVGEAGVRALAAQLAGYGGAVEVVDPPEELRAEMRRIAGELADAWR